MINWWKLVLHVAWKEVRDNLRDKRALFFSLVYGPLLMPCIILGPLVVMSGNKAAQYASVKTIHVAHPEKTPNLVAYLKSKNIDVEKADAEFRALLKTGEYNLVLDVSENYAENLMVGKPAEVFLYYVNDNNRSRERYQYISGALATYANSIVGQRMWARGINPSILAPLTVEAVDLSTSEPLLATIASMLQFLVILSVVMGGFYLAVDVVAGERERGSLEPLLSLPISIRQLVAGKYLAVFFFCYVCGLGALTNAFIWLNLLPGSIYASADTPTFTTFIKFILLILPLAALLASLLLLVSTFAKTVKEAQTQLSAVMMLAMAPFIAMQLLDVDVRGVFSVLPIAGHYLFAESLLFDADFSLTTTLNLSFFSVVLLLAFLFLTCRLFRDDKFLN